MEKKITVCVDVKYPVKKNPNIISIYLEAVNILGHEEVFLLESCAGPSVDNRESIVGAGRLSTVQFYSNRLEISAVPSLLPALQLTINDALGENRCEAGTCDLKSSDEIWECVRALNEFIEYRSDPLSKFNFGYLTLFSYENARLIEKLPTHEIDDEIPLITLSLFQSYFILSTSGDVRVSSISSNLIPKPAIDFVEILQRAPKHLEGIIKKYPVSSVKYTVSQDEYVAKANIALAHIRRGDIYQVQIGHEICVKTELEPTVFYQRLRETNPSPYMFICSFGSFQLIGASPEQFLRLDSNGISMRPIAGTIAKDPEQTTTEIMTALKSSAKECAEHIMLVDLCRNDISRACATNTLDTPSLMSVEEYPSLFHLVSTVTGKLSDSKDAVDLIKAAFPAGTMTGAPKIRAMEIIDDLEVTRRNAYAGAVGLMGPGNALNLALCIRSALYKDGIYHIRASAGVVADSDPQKEWQETLAKMGAVYTALTGEHLVA